MAQRALAPEYWAMCLEHVYSVENCLPHSAFDDRESPYTRWHETVPDLSRLRPFGCDVRVTVPRDHPDWKKYVIPPGWFGIYVGEKSDGAAHLVYRPGERGQKGNLEDVGDRLCQFYDSYDTKLYLLTKDDPTYREYLVYGDSDPASPPTVPSASEFRIARKFGSEWCFGTANRNSDPGEYKYDIRYDDGDFESMSQSEVDAAKRHFETQQKTNPRAQGGCGSDTYTVLPGKIKVTEIVDHKVVLTSFNNWIAVVKCRYDFTVAGSTSTRVEWVTVGALLSCSTNFTESWSMLRDYVTRFYKSSKDKTRYRPQGVVSCCSS
jgi:hypothetical protein